MKKVKSHFKSESDYWDNTPVEKFFLYKIIYPIVNTIGLNRPFNLLRHKIGLYNEFPDGRCMWCGEKHNK